MGRRSRRRNAARRARIIRSIDPILQHHIEHTRARGAVEKRCQAVRCIRRGYLRIPAPIHRIPRSPKGAIPIREIASACGTAAPAAASRDAARPPRRAAHRGGSDAAARGGPGAEPHAGRHARRPAPQRARRSPLRGRRSAQSHSNAAGRGAGRRRGTRPRSAQTGYKNAHRSMVVS